MTESIKEQSAKVTQYIEEHSQKVLQYVCSVIAHPHKTITEHDRHRALEIIRYMYSDDQIVEHLFSQMKQDDFRLVKNIRDHARKSTK